jgi:hypothetical protein
MPVQQRPAPAKRASPVKTPGTHPVVSSRAKAREEALNDWGRLGQMVCIFRGMYADAGAIAEHGPKLTREMALMGDSNEKIAKWLDYAAESGPIMGAFGAALPLVMQLMANHGKIDAEKLPPEAGIVSPKLLEERIRAEMELANAQILRDLNELRRQAAEMTLELERIPQ